jgi:transposase
MPIPLRADFDAQMVLAAAKRSKDGAQARRLLALAAIYEGATRTEAAKIGGVTLQIVRDWVLKFNAHGPDGLIDRKPPGQAPRLNDMHRAALAAVIESGPIPAVHGVVRWRIRSLPMDLRGISRRRRQADAEPRTARHGLNYRPAGIKCPEMIPVAPY